MGAATSILALLASPVAQAHAAGLRATAARALSAASALSWHSQSPWLGAAGRSRCAVKTAGSGVAARRRVSFARRQRFMDVMTSVTKDAEASAEMDGEVSLDRESFKRVIPVVALKVPKKKTGMLLKKLKAQLLNIPKFKNVENLEGEDDVRLVLLGRHVTDPATLEGLDANARREVEAEGLGRSGTVFSLEMGYEDMSAEQVLRQLLGSRLGPNEELITCFETAGHVAHLNLREHLLPYKHVIAQVILDKNQPRLRTVVNKVGSIETQFRTFPMEVLAGEDDTKVELKESGCVFRFDYRKVYWNSRLQHEHDRNIKECIRAADRPSGVVVADMMAGVGPFAVPLAKRGCRVYANDLNPECYAALVENGKRNGCGGRLSATNMCGREFIRGLLNGSVAEDPVRGSKPIIFHRVLMNLPATGLEFLDVFSGVDWAGKGFSQPPIIHVYCFSRAENPENDALERAAGYLGLKEVDTLRSTLGATVHIVRLVAPGKPMMCLSFRAPSPDMCNAAAAPVEKRSLEEGVDGDAGSEEPETKKLKASSTSSSE